MEQRVRDPQASADGHQCGVELDADHNGSRIMARARWSDGNRREFKNGLWPVWAVLATLAWVDVVLRLTHSGARWETLLPVATAAGATALALVGAHGKLPVRWRNKR